MLDLDAAKLSWAATCGGDENAETADLMIPDLFREIERLRAANHDLRNQLNIAALEQAAETTRLIDGGE
jgi:hypothetical protein